MQNLADQDLVGWLVVVCLVVGPSSRRSPALSGMQESAETGTVGTALASSTMGLSISTTAERCVSSR